MSRGPLTKGTTMDTMEKVEQIREKTGVSYEDAKAALDANNNDVLDAIIWLEREGKATTTTARATTAADTSGADAMGAAQAAYEQSTTRSAIKDDAAGLWEAIKKAFAKSVEIKMVATRNGQVFFSLPLIVPILGLLFWGATIWLLILGLFFGLRYRFDTPGKAANMANDVMDKAANMADHIKEEIQDHE